MEERVQYQEKTIAELKLASFNDQKKHKVLNEKVSHYQRFMVILKEEDLADYNCLH